MLFERVLAEARRTYSPANYQAMAQGYLMEIDRLQAEIREYLSRIPEPIYTKGKFTRERGLETYYFLLSSKRAVS